MFQEDLFLYNCHQDDPDPVIVPVQSYKYMWRRQWGNARHGTLQPYLFSCQVLFHFNFSQPTCFPLHLDKHMKQRGAIRPKNQCILQFLMKPKWFQKLHTLISNSYSLTGESKCAIFHLHHISETSVVSYKI